MELKDMFSLDRKTIFITGGSGYLGSAMSEALAEFGATLVIGSRDINKNKEFCSTLTEKYNNLNESIELDISDSKSVDSAIAKIINKHGKIDVLINNSYYGAGTELHRMEEQDWIKGIDGSINGVYRCTKKVLDNMINNRTGKIINIASMYGIVAPDISIYEGNDFYNPCNYGVGKAGIVQFTKYIAAVYGRYGITCNSISPGPFPNKKVQENKEFIKKLENKVPLTRIGDPTDLKGVVLLLASQASNYINGANISVDGGWTIW